MRRIKLTAIIFTMVIIVLATVSVFSLIRYNKQTVQKPAAPITVEKITSKPIQPTEAVTEKPEIVNIKPKQLSKPAPQVVEVPKPVIAKTLPIRRPVVSAVPTAVSVESEPAPETFAEGQDSFYAGTGTNWYRSIGNKSAMPKDLRNAAIPNAASYNRHREIYRTISPYLQSPTSNYSKEQIQQLNAELAEKLPEKYGKMVLDLQVLKEQEIARRQSAEQQARNSQPDGSDL